MLQKNKLIRLVGVLLIVAVTVAVFYALRDMRRRNYENLGLSPITLTLDELNLKDFDLVRDGASVIRSTSDDPWLQVAFPEPLYIDSIVFDIDIIDYGMHIDNMLYYSTNAARSFVEQNKLPVDYKEGFFRYDLPIGRVTALRMDIMAVEGAVAVVRGVRINSYLPPVAYNFSGAVFFSLLFSLLYLLALAASELIGRLIREKSATALSLFSRHTLWFALVALCISVVIEVYHFVNEFTLRKKFFVYDVALIAGLGAYIALVMIWHRCRKLHVRAAAMILVFGAVIVFANPPMQIPDEPTHFYRAYTMGYGHWDLGHKDPVPRSADYLIHLFPPYYYGTHHQTFGSNLYESFAAYGQAVAQIPPGETAINAYSNIPHLLPYIPAAIGVFVSRAFGDNALVSLYFARAFALLFYAACCAFALRNADRFRNILLCVMFMPMSIAIAASCSYDCVLFSLSFIFLSYCFRKEAGARDIAVMFAVFALMSTIKSYTYLPLCLCVFLIPREGWRFRVPRLVVTGAIGAAGIAALLLLDLYNAHFARMLTEGELAPTVSIFSGASFFIHHFADYFLILLRNVYNGLLGSYIGYLAYFGWFDMDAVLATLLMPFFLFYMAIADGDEFYPGRDRGRAIALSGGIFAVAYTVICTAFYIVWTGIGKQEITGVQGRYFIPILAMALIFVAGIAGRLFKLQFRPRNKYDVALVGCSVITAVAFIEIFAKYYIGRARVFF